MIGIIDYGVGNLRSVQKAIEFLGKEAVISADASFLKGCSHLILPGVGSFGAGMEELRKSGLDKLVLNLPKETKLLGICLGMQMLFEASEEDVGAVGLGILPGTVKKFAARKVPHMGWNDLAELKDGVFDGISEGEKVYFVHSYFCKHEEAEIAAATYEGVTFSAAVRKENVFGMQFHPEKSGEVGLKILANFLR